MMKVWNIQWSPTEVVDAWLEQWSCQFLVEGLERICTMRTIVRAISHNFIHNAIRDATVVLL